MILRNPTGRAVRLEIPAGAGDEAAMVLTIGAHASARPEHLSASARHDGAGCQGSACR